MTKIHLSLATVQVEAVDTVNAETFLMHEAWNTRLFQEFLE